MQHGTLSSLGDLSFISATGFCITLTKFLATKYKRKSSDKTEQLKKIMIHLQETYDVSFLPLEYFSWVKSNKFACMWLWIKIRTETLHESRRRAGRFIQINRYKSRPRYYSYTDVLGLEQHPVNHEERFNLIINFLDKHSEKYRAEIRERSRQKYSHKLVLIQELRYLNDKKYIEDLKYQWLNTYNKDDPLNWVKKTDENQCRWIWSFLQDEHSLTPAVDGKKDQTGYVEKEIVVFNDEFPFKLFLFANNEERYLGIYGVVHNTPDSENKKKLLGLMKKLWLQNARRKNSKKRK